MGDGAEAAPCPKRPRRACVAVREVGKSSMSLEVAAALLCKARDIVVISGSGISVASGLATFTKKGGTYERARKKFKLKQGIDLFHWRFYEERPLDSLWFLATMYDAVAKAEPTATHHAVQALEWQQRLRRHFTMNIDGLHARAGATVWNGHDDAIAERTVELHGNLHSLVDISTGSVYAVDGPALRRIKARKAAFGDEGEDAPEAQSTGTAIEDYETSPALVRFRVLLYNDEEHHAVLNGEAAMATLAADAAAADLVLWLGISFEQSASCGYLRKVEAALCAAGKATPQLIVNPCEEAYFNAASALEAPATLTHVTATSDELFAACARCQSSETAPAISSPAAPVDEPTAAAVQPSPTAPVDEPSPAAPLGEPAAAAIRSSPAVPVDEPTAADVGEPAAADGPEVPPPCAQVADASL
ncbi:DHS-like NAD/FAD-binding domain-containing protein [Pelagophyceae sp. CCMP2097]|nr:DHS-like NAD/FAD-binding domain-containing protein [Pelagophyceae sp. CCMP2097]